MGEFELYFHIMLSYKVIIIAKLHEFIMLI